MKSISLYVKQDTYLTELHPFARLFYILATVTMLLVTGKMWVFVLFIAMSLCLPVSGRIAARVFPLIAFSFTIITTVFLIHGLFNQTNRNVLFVPGPFKFYREGLVYTARIGFNILNMLLAFTAFMLSTKPDQLMDDLEQIGFSPKFGYMISFVFQIIPQMIGTMNTIMDAQRSRGMETEGNLFVRAKAFIPLITPVVSNSLINTRERAIALGVRGFDSRERRTFLTDGKMSGRDKALILIMCLIIAGSVIWRIVHVID